MSAIESSTESAIHALRRVTILALSDSSTVRPERASRDALGKVPATVVAHDAYAQALAKALALLTKSAYKDVYEAMVAAAFMAQKTREAALAFWTERCDAMGPDDTYASIAATTVAEVNAFAQATKMDYLSACAYLATRHSEGCRNVAGH